MSSLDRFFDDRRKQLRRLDPVTRIRQTIDVNKNVSCHNCKEVLIPERLAERLYVCPHCESLQRMPAMARLEYLLEEGWESIDEPAVFNNPLEFEGYQESWERATAQGSLDEAIGFARGKILGQPVILGVMDPYFMMGSMGSIVGERVCQAFERASKEELPVVICCASGGARMQEGLFSLMQMRRTAAAVRNFQASGGFYVAVLTDPTTGGVTASFASLGNVTLAERQALIGFAGPRVIRETIQTNLPEGFQQAEFQREHGFVDRVVRRENLAMEIARMLAFHSVKQEFKPGRLNDVTHLPGGANHVTPEVLRESTPEDAYAKVKAARDVNRPSPKEILASLCEEIVTLSGDRYYGDDQALQGGLALFNGQPMTWLINEKGEGLESQIRHHFGMPHPEGYRKAIRLMQEAEAFGRPILTIIDTPGAYPGLGAEERGQGAAIADALAAMSELTVPVIALVSGEAGSGGALGIACADKVYMLEGAVYTLLSAEAFSTILWKDASRAPEAAARMRATAEDCYELGFCDGIFPDDLTGLKDHLIADLEGRRV